MLRNYLAAALRNLARNRLYTVINVIGLAVGFGAALLIAVFVRDELSYDRFFPGHEQIYLLGSEHRLPGRATEYPDSTPHEMAAFLRSDFPEIASVARVGGFGPISVRRGEIENLERVAWADSSFIDIFKFPVVAGELSRALERPDGLIITRSMARKYFGRNDPIGETIELLRSAQMTVTAVIEDLPSNTHLALDFIGAGHAAASMLAKLDSKQIRVGYYSLTSYTYLKVSDGAAARNVQAALPAFLKRHKPAVVDNESGLSVTLVLRPITSLHLAPGVFGSLKPRGRVETLLAMTAIGALILFAVGVNFINLMTARAARRAVEVGVRKLSGAARLQLTAQFIGEAFMYASAGMIIGAACAAALLPALNTFLEKTIPLSAFAHALSLSVILGICGVFAIAAGAYPALVLSSFRPAVVLGHAYGQGPASQLVRNLLAMLQFAVLIGLFIASGVAHRQMTFALHEAQPLESDHVFTVPTPCASAFSEVVRTVPGVLAVACSSYQALGTGESLGAARTLDGEYISLANHSVGFGFFELYGLKPVAGRFFAEDRAGDQVPAAAGAASTGAVILNEAAVRRLGFRSPEDAVGKATSINATTGALSEIIGVVPDFALDAVRQAVPPIVYVASPNRQGLLSLRIDPARAPETLVAIDAVWKQTGAPEPITRVFLDQRIAELYASIGRQRTLFAVLAAVALVITALGLIGTSIATSEGRTKEIGVRKSMGASRADILRLLLWQFAKPVLLANLIAWPVAYLVMQRWLEGFAHHIDLAPWMFLAASALALLIAVAAVIGHALLVARAQPVHALRYE